MGKVFETLPDYREPDQPITLRLFQENKPKWQATLVGGRPTVRKIYQDWGADPIGIGNLFRTRFATFDDWLAYRWADHVRDLQTNVEVLVLIRRFGVILENPSTESKVR